MRVRIDDSIVLPLDRIVVLRCAQGTLSLQLELQILGHRLTYHQTYARKYLIPANKHLAHTHTQYTSIYHVCSAWFCRFCIFRNQKRDTPLYSWFVFSCFSAHIPNKLWFALELKEAGSQPSLLPTVPQFRRCYHGPVVCHVVISAIRLHISVLSSILLFLHPKWFRILSVNPLKMGSNPMTLVLGVRIAAEAPQ